MNYNTLECVLRRAVADAFGGGSPDFDKWLLTGNPNAGIDMAEHLPEVSVELAFDPSISPFVFFSGEVSMLADFDLEEESGMLHLFLGEDCSNPTLANEYADRFNEEAASEWLVEDMIEEDSALHLVVNFSCPLKDISKELSLKVIETQLALLLSRLKEDRVANSLRSFAHYFEA